MIVLVGGCSGSGKTTLCQHIIKQAEKSNITVGYFCHDYYYHDLSHLDMKSRVKTNFDHPDSLDTSGLVRDLTTLRDQKSTVISIPRYNYETHTRNNRDPIQIKQSQLYLVEGILVLNSPALRKLADLTIYLDVDRDIALSRRILRDITTRGRIAKEVVSQYLTSVRPMDILYVRPCRNLADVIIDTGENDSQQYQSVVTTILEQSSWKLFSQS